MNAYRKMIMVPEGTTIPELQPSKFLPKPPPPADTSKPIFPITATPLSKLDKQMEELMTDPNITSGLKRRLFREMQARQLHIAGKDSTIVPEPVVHTIAKRPSPITTGPPLALE